MICGFALSLARYVLVSRTRILDGWVRNSRRQSLDCSVAAAKKKVYDIQKLRIRVTPYYTEMQIKVCMSC